jgi:hypothetical protein
MAPSSNSDSESESATAGQNLPGIDERVSPAAATGFSEALLSCRDALRRRPLTDPHERWQEAVGVLCNAARREGVSPERFLVHFKRVLDDVEEFQAIPGETAETPRSRIITLAIEWYFKDR